MSFEAPSVELSPMPAQDPPVFLSIVMPVYNEEHCLAESIRRITAFMTLKNWTWELLIASDGSKDRTDAIAQEAALRDRRVRALVSEKNLGKGATVRRGVLAASGKNILVTDADLAAPVKEADKLLAALEEGADVAIGSRAIRKDGCDVQQSWQRAFSGRVFNFLVRSLVIKGFRDTQCGFKCFKREAALPLFKAQRLDGFSFDVEILCLAFGQGLKVKEVPVMWRAGEKSKVRLFKDSFRMVRELFFLRKIYRRAGSLAVRLDPSTDYARSGDELPRGHAPLP